MNINDSIMLMSHGFLLIIKFYSVYFMMSKMMITKAPNQKSFLFIFKPLEFMLLIFSLIISISELLFICYYFIDVESLMYEQLAILDEIVFTIFTIYYFKKGANNGN